MKNYLKFLLLISSFFFLSSCGDDNNSGIEGGTMVAKIDGNNFNGSFVNASINTVLGADIFTLVVSETTSGVDFNSLSILFDLPISGGAIEEKNYQFSGNDCNLNPDNICASLSYGDFASQNSSLKYSSGEEGGHCNINFSSIDYRVGGHAIGTFSGTLVNDSGDMVIVTDGKFNLEINN